LVAGVVLLIHMLTLRQIEVIRAIMITGSVGGAARLLNVSSPGISRVMKHAEGLLGVKLFGRKGGRYTPTREASDICTQINGVYDKVGDLGILGDRRIVNLFLCGGLPQAGAAQ